MGTENGDMEPISSLKTPPSAKKKESVRTVWYQYMFYKLFLVHHVWALWFYDWRWHPTTLVQTGITQQLLDGLPQRFVPMFTVLTTMKLNDICDPQNFPPAPP